MFRKLPLMPGGPWFLYDIHDNLKEINGVQGSNIDSALASTQSQYGTAVSQATGNIQASDNANVSDSGNLTLNMVDPGIVTAFERFADDNTVISGQALQDAAASQATSAALTSQALKQAADLEKTATRTPIQDFLPVIIAGVVLVLGIIYFNSRKS